MHRLISAARVFISKSRERPAERRYACHRLPHQLYAAAKTVGHPQQARPPVPRFIHAPSSFLPIFKCVPVKMEVRTQGGCSFNSASVRGFPVSGLYGENEPAGPEVHAPEIPLSGAGRQLRWQLVRYWSKIKTWFAPQVLTPCLGFWPALTVIGVAALMSSRSERSMDRDSGAVASPIERRTGLSKIPREAFVGIGNEFVCLDGIAPRRCGVRMSERSSVVGNPDLANLKLGILELVFTEPECAPSLKNSESGKKKAALAISLQIFVRPRGGQVVWSYTHSGRGEISEAVLEPNGHILSPPVWHHRNHPGQNSGLEF